MGTQGHSSTSSERRLLHNRYKDDMGGSNSCCTIAGTLRKFAGLNAVYGGFVLGIVLSLFFFQTITIENNFHLYYAGGIACVAVVLLINSPAGLAVSFYKRGYLICFLILTLLALSAEVTLLAMLLVAALTIADNPSAMRYAPGLRLFLEVISPLLPEGIANIIKEEYTSDDERLVPFMYGLCAFGGLLLFLQLLSIILSSIAICKKRVNTYDGQSTLQRSNSVYYERGPMWATEDIYANTQWRN